MTMFQSIVRAVWGISICVLFAGGLAAQRPPSASVPAPYQMPPVADRLPVTYVIAPRDVILIQAVNADQLSGKPFRVDIEGFLTLPLIGRVRAAGLTIESLEAVLTASLKEFVRNPQVTISVVERGQAVTAQQSVWLLGAFTNPGIYPLSGRDTVLDLLTRAGGFQSNASHRIRLTRRSDQGPIPLPTAVEEANASSVEIRLNQNLEPTNANETVELKPYDVLNVTRLEMVYVAGEFARTGGFNLEGRESLSVTQLISLAGLNPSADARKARVLRPVLDTSRRAEIPVDAEAILRGRANDFLLMPNDVLFVPRAKGRAAKVGRFLAVAAPVALGAVVYSLVN